MLSRKDRIRTGDLCVPNATRYQLRYFPMRLKMSSKNYAIFSQKYYFRLKNFFFVPASGWVSIIARQASSVRVCGSVERGSL